MIKTTNMYIIYSLTAEVRLHIIKEAYINDLSTILHYHICNGMIHFPLVSYNNKF